MCYKSVFKLHDLLEQDASLVGTFTKSTKFITLKPFVLHSQCDSNIVSVSGTFRWTIVLIKDVPFIVVISVFRKIFLLTWYNKS